MSVAPVAATAVDTAASEPPLQPPIGAECWICLDGDPDDEGKPIVRDCSCRGDDAGFAHLSCLIKYARNRTSELIEIGEGDSFGPWKKCPNCSQDYQRQVALDMARSLLSFVDEIADENYPRAGILKVGGSEMIQ